MKIDQVYVISLDHSEEYIKDLFDRLSRIPLPYDTPVFIIEGFLGKRLKDETDLEYTLYDKWDISDQNLDWHWWERPTTYGEAGGMISHTMCWEDAYNNDYDTIMILEDDFEPEGDLDWSIFDEMEGYDWDLCLMAHNSLHSNFNNIHPPYEIGKEHFIRPTYFYNSHTYILKKEGIRKLVEDHLPTLKDNIIVSDEFLSAVITTHPREDLRVLYPPNINPIATKYNWTYQTRYMSAGNSLTEPTEDDIN
jgi:GR25 family glycosyltransferase involved in LPS biosynthesis